MKGRVVAVGTTAGAGGGAIGGGYAALNVGLISERTWYFLWPSLVAAVFLALAVVAIFLGAKRWLWPLLTGFVVQTIGVIVYAVSDEWETPVPTLLWTLGAVALVLIVMGVVALISFLRARRIERELTSPAASAGVDPAELDEIRGKMQEALALLSRAGHGRNAIYELPWFLVIGRSAAGKTVAIKESKLGLPVRRDWIKGDGGNHTCEWFFTNDMIFLDTPGAWVTDGASDDAQVYWKELLGRIRRARGRRPLDGLVVVVPADDLLSKEPEELQEQSANIREIIDLLQSELQFRFPVYVLVSKSDLIEGFVDFFYGLPAQRRDEILGWSNPEPSRGDPARMVEKGCRAIESALETYRLEMLAKGAGVTRNRKLFFFPEEFRRTVQPLREFVDTLCMEDPSTERLVFRGFYFTSGTQEGSPLSSAMSDLARTLGVSPRAALAGGEPAGKPKSFFLLELFRELMVGDEGLVGRTAYHWWRQRRATFFASFLPAGIGVMFLILALVAFLRNGALYRTVERRVPEIVQELAVLDPASNPSDVLPALRKVEEIREMHRKMVGLAPFRRFGMRRPGRIEERTLAVFNDQFRSRILRPTLARAENLATGGEGRSCLDRLEILQGVVWLRMGERRDWDQENMQGFNKVWGLVGEDAADARNLLVREFRYHSKTTRLEEMGSHLPGFSVLQVARRYKDDCGAEGATSALMTFEAFQSRCLDPGSPREVKSCVEEMNGALRTSQEDIVALGRRVNRMKEDLQELVDYESEAAPALKFIEPLDVVADEKCVTDFSSGVREELREYLERSDEYAAECRQTVSTISDRAQRYAKADDLLGQYREALSERESALEQSVERFNTQCREAVRGFDGIDFRALRQTAANYRTFYCLDRIPSDEEVRETVQARPTPRPAAPRARPRPRPPASPARDLKWFDRARVPGGSSSPDRWYASVEIWQGRLAAAELSPGQRSFAEGEVRNEVAGFVRRYRSAWASYLESLELEPPTGTVPGWLKDLSTSTEWVNLLEPAARAVSAGDASDPPPFDQMYEALAPYRGVVDLAGPKLNEYLGYLGRVADDLARAESDLDEFQRFKREFRSRNPGNSLVQALDWVERNVGAGLAKGALRSLFREPLEAASRHVLSGNRLNDYWGDLRQRYLSKLRDAFPFNADFDAEPAEFDEIRALLGGETGLVTSLRALAGAGEVSPDVEAWLSEAGELSEILFEEGSDEPRAIPVTLALQDATLELSKKADLTVVRWQLGEDAEFEWKEDEGEPRPEKVRVHVLGDDASEYSSVQAWLKIKKGLILNYFKDPFKDAKQYAGPSAEGAWAPLRLIARQMQGGLSQYRGGPAIVEFEIAVDDLGTLVIPVRVEGSEVERLLLLMKDGLRLPPALVGGGR